MKLRIMNYKLRKFQSGFIKFTKRTLVSYLIISIVFFGTGLIYLFNPFGTSRADAAWFNDNWAYRKAITVTNSSDFTDRFVHFNIDTTEAPEKFQTDCGDIRFTDINGNILDYYYNTGADQCDNAGTDFYVNLNTILNGTMTVYMYYGNPSAVNGYLEGDFQGADVVVDGVSYASEEKGTAPIAYWKFDDAQGSTTQDSTSNNKDGSITGGITWITEDQCLAGKCIDKPNASGSFVTVASPNLPTGDFTYSGWVNLKNNDTETLFNSSNGSATNELSINITTTKVATYTDGTLRVTSTNAVSTNTWTHIAVVRSGSSGSNIKIYINGSQDPTAGSDSGAALNFGSCRLMIGATDASSCSGTTTSANLGGRMDEFKIYNQALTANQIKALYNSSSNLEGLSTSLGKNIQNSPGSLSNGLVGYWKMDESSGNASDSSGNANTLTNNATIVYSAGKFAYGADIEANNSQYFTVADNASLQLGSTLTMSTWIKPESLAGCSSCTIRLMGKGSHSQDGAGNISAGVNIRGDTSNNSSLQSYITTDGTTATRTTHQVTTPLVTGTWYHITWVYDGTTSNLYKDGILIGSQAMSGTPYDDTQTFMVGGSINNYYDGLIDETRVYKRALSANEVSQLYNWAPGPVGYWKMDEGSGTTIADSSGNGYTSSAFTGNTSSTNGKYGKGLTFDGTDDVVRIPEGTYTDLGATTDSFTTEAWFKTTTDFSTAATILTKRNNGAGGYPFQISLDSSERLTAAFYDGTTTVSFTITGTKNDGKWHHAALVRDVFSDTAYFYIDGVLASSTNDTTTGSLANNSDISIGAGNVNASYIDNDFNGQIDDARIYNYARTQAQIIEDMNAGHPAPGSPVGTPILNMRFDEGYGTTARNNGNGGTGITGTLTSMASPATSTSGWTNAGKFGKGILFDGSDDVITTGTPAALQLTSSISLSAWVKFTGTLATNGRATVLGSFDNTNGYLLDYIDTSGTKSLRFTGPSVTGACTVNNTLDSNWNHLVVTYDGSTTTNIYKNGILVGTCASSGAIGVGSRGTYIGARPSTVAGQNFFTGTIDEVNIYAGVLTADQVKLAMNRSSSEVLGSMGASSDKQPQSAANEYCPPDSSSAACTGPVGEWKFDEGSGTTANDTSGNGNTGTITAGTGRYVNGKINKAYSFDAANTVINMGSATAFDDLSALTAEAWIYPKSTGEGTFGRIIQKMTTAGNPGWIVMMTNSPSNSLRFDVDTDTVDLSVISSGSSITLNQWNHIAVTWTGSLTATNVHLYINGKETGYSTQTNGTGSRTSDAAANLLFGNDSSSSRTFDGYIDTGRVFNYARTPAQIAWSYNKGLPIGYWKMDECQGTTINDASGNGNSGTLTIGASGSNTAVGTCQTSGAWFDGATGKRNYSMDFDGTDDYINVPYNSIFGITQNITLSAWIKKSADGDFGGIVSKTNGIDTWDYDFYVCTDAVCGEGRADYLSFYSDAEGALFSNIKITGTNWHHVAVTRAGSTATIYVDGIPAGSDSFYNSAFNNNSLPIRIGTDGPTYDADSSFNGQIDDVRIYNYGLTHTQIKSLFNEGATRFGPATGAP